MVDLMDDAGVVPSTADVMDRFGDRASIIDLFWHRFGAKPAFCGPAATFLANNDTVLIRQMLETPGEGRVLVIDNHASRQHAVFGDKFGALLLKNGWAGAIINGLTRDAGGLSSLGISVFALGTCPRRPKKDGVGTVNAILQIGGVKIASGDWITADADGVVVIKAAEIPCLQGMR